MKERPTVLYSCTSGRSDKWGRRLGFSLVRWQDLSLSYVVGLSTRNDVTKQSRFTRRRVNIPFEFFGDLEVNTLFFVKNAKAVLAKLEAAKAAAKAQADADDSDANQDNSQNEDDTQ